ncbi:hypothetical protein EsDP_00005425 [Epichloe bromicola]|uniref:BRCT domain-containing protein n=1 Tax=Epichloe bromicola TaxID=79588 RepID=A0ABQ0CUM4_9HYPO
MDSPPKRMTRARAAAKASAVTTNTTRIVTAAAKARSLATATANTKSTSAKRKTRADEKDDDGNELADINTRRAVRARSGNHNEPEGSGTASVDAASTRNSRTRTTSKTTIDVSNDDRSAAVARIRGRARKLSAQEPTPATQGAGGKTSRARSGTGIVPKTASDRSKTIARRTVKFQESGKENMSLASKAKETPTTNVLRGLRARPTRRGTASVPVESSQPAPQALEKGQKKPLSPKKVTQMPISRERDVSEDELVVGDGMKVGKKSPMRMPTSEALNNKEAKDNSFNNEDDKSRDATKLEAGPAPVAFGSPPRRPTSSPSKETLKSPAKRIGGLHLPGSILQSRTIPTVEKDIQTSPNRSSALLKSPAKRPCSPTKGLKFTTMSFGGMVHNETSANGCLLLQSPAKQAMPGAVPLTRHHARDDALLTGPPQMQLSEAAAPPVALPVRPSDLLPAEEVDDSAHNLMADELFNGPIEHLPFPGRMSAVLPRQTDSSLTSLNEQTAENNAEDIVPVLTGEAIISETEENEASINGEGEEYSTRQDGRDLQPVGVAQESENENLTNMENMNTEMVDTGEASAYHVEADAAVAQSQHGLNFQLRDDALDPCCNSRSDIESEDDLSPFKTISVARDSRDRRASNRRDSLYATRRNSRRYTTDLTPLAKQSGAWSATSPVENDAADPIIVKDSNSTFFMGSTPNTATISKPDPSLIESTFFEDEIVVHTEFSSSKEQSMVQPREDESDDVILMEDIAMHDEDVALAEEANNMSLMSQQHSYEVADTLTLEENPSEASQEYGDENETPMDPVLSREEKHQTITPTRPLQQKAFFTTTKVPLKPADDSESSPLKKRSFSACRASSKNAGCLPRSATVISYSPTKEKRRASILPEEDFFLTPTKGDQWSSAATPGRTPRRHVDPSLLRGAVVLVDVHTTEGADASGIFIELLTHMGAKCVKTWHWNPGSSGNGNSSSSKIGITHVVFKDGGKRTMEKVREAGRVVHCVGVSWVLDCERDEAPYNLDTSIIPRGGARRRKSMEPKAIANLNGTIVASTNKTSGPPSTPKNRRESTLWMRTPPEQSDEDDEKDLEWSCALLTPVPKTPAPEALAKYASELPETPSSQEDTDLMSPTKHILLTRTCPLKEGRYHDLGHGILGRDKDEQVMMRLMAARRKSLQFAPKIGSPLARTWD